MQVLLYIVLIIYPVLMIGTAMLCAWYKDRTHTHYKREMEELLDKMNQTIDFQRKIIEMDLKK